VGDEVAVRFEGFAPVKAVVNHTLNSASGKWDGNQCNLPVLIRRGALSKNTPAADLCLTALHAVYVDGFLMNVGDLINGTSIIFETADGQDKLEFFNIELDRHDILNAQGAFCESLCRAGTDRCAPLLGFDGGRSKLRSHMRSVASLVIDWRQPIDIIRDKLEERGLGFARAA
jgi:Hint domain